MSKTLDQLTAGLKQLDTVDAVWRQHNSFAKNKNGDIIAFSLSGSKVESIVLDEKAAALEYLYLAGNEGLKEVVFSAPMPRLVHLNLSRCKELTSLKMPGGCLALRQVNLQGCGLEKLEWEGEYPGLELLDASENAWKSFTIPAGFAGLKYLYVEKNEGLKHFQVVPELANLEILSLRDNKLESVPEEVILSSPLEALYLKGNAPKNILKVLLGGNCLNYARLWFQELRDYSSERNKVIKLMLTGNGSSGKSTLLCALKNGKCDCTPGHESTNGVVIETVGLDSVIFNIWDFGGQEVYHGTHRLFISQGLQVIVIDPKAEEDALNFKPVPDRIEDELTIHHPFQYWFETTKKLSPDSRFVFVQNKKDESPEKYVPASHYAAQKNAEIVHVSARTGEGIRILKGYLEDNAKELPEYDMLMPSSWLKVRQFFIENLQKKDSSKRITYQEFEALCDQCGVWEQTRKQLLIYLHHSGFLYRHEKLGDQIITDQRWALKAIYKPYERGTADYKDFRRSYPQGFISAYRLFRAFGDEYATEDKWLFLSFMQSCGLCFKLHSFRKLEVSEDDIYVFPEFLPPDKPSHLVTDWALKTKDVHVFRYRLPWLNYFLIQSFITALGQKTETSNMWRNGIHVPTPGEGWFRVELDYTQPALMLYIEETAMANWLIPILREFHLEWEGISWEMSVDNGVNFQPFDPEAWKQPEKEIRPERVEQTSPQEETASAAGRLASIEQVFKRVVLFVSANPEGEITRRFEDELKEIKEGLQLSQNRDYYDIKECLAAQFEDLRRNLLSIHSPAPMIVHFSGHGSDLGEIIIEDAARKGRALNAGAVGKLFELFKDKVQCVVLNARHSEKTAREIAKNIDWTIGMSGEMPHQSGIVFSVAFYEGLAGGLGVKKAFELGKNAIALVKLEGEQVPVLIAKSSLDL